MFIFSSATALQFFKVKISLAPSFFKSKPLSIDISAKCFFFLLSAKLDTFGFGVISAFGLIGTFFFLFTIPFKKASGNDRFGRNLKFPPPSVSYH